VVAVVLAATKSEALQSWAAAAAFGAASILFGIAQPFITSLTMKSGRRWSPGPLKRLFPENEEGAFIQRNRQLMLWIGSGFLVVGSVGFIVRLALPS